MGRTLTIKPAGNNAFPQSDAGLCPDDMRY
jgi:hypothetical protein